jgi:hypothetical protein
MYTVHPAREVAEITLTNRRNGVSGMELSFIV